MKDQEALIRDENQERCSACGSLVCICCNDTGPQADNRWAAHCRRCGDSITYIHPTAQSAADEWNDLQRNDPIKLCAKQEGQSDE